VLFLHGDARIVGTAWMAVGFAGDVLYHCRQGLSLVRTATLSPLETSTEVEVSYTNILVPVSENGVSEEMMVKAGMPAADQGTTIEALTVIEMPINLPLSAGLPGVEEAADRLLERAKRIGEEYGANVVTHAVRARQAGRAIVDEARQLGVEVIMLGAPAGRGIGDRLFGRTTDYVLRNAPLPGDHQLGSGARHGHGRGGGGGGGARVPRADGRRRAAGGATGRGATAGGDAGAPAGRGGRRRSGGPSAASGPPGGRAG
jgi:nucleotide-binding universal stress UspA family protein